MFKNDRAVLGAICLATASLATTSSALAFQQNSNNDLNTTSQVEPLRGALQGLSQPTYDGPIKWERPNITGAGEVILFGGLGALFAGCVGVAATSRNYDGKEITNGLMAAVVGGALSLGTGVLMMQSNPKLIQFDTRVAEIQSDTPPHTEMFRVRSGKTTRLEERGPFFGQVVNIPETDFYLAANSYKAPLMPGQKIKATFYVDKDSNQILSWSAVPGAR